MLPTEEKVRGKYITIDGPECCGKTSLIKRLMNEFPQFEYVREPGDERLEVTQKIRDILLNTNEGLDTAQESMLYAVDRSSITALVKQYVENGHTVVSDRSFLSSLVYQGDLGLSKILMYNRDAIKIFPDISFVITLEYELMLERLNKKEKDRMESKGEEFLRTVCNRYAHLRQDYYECENGETFNALKLVYIDGNKSLSEIYKIILSYI